MNRDPEETYDLLARTYRVAKLLAVSVVSFVGVLVAIAALNLELSDAWSAIRVPLYVAAFGGLALLFVLGAPLLFTLVLLRDSMVTSSFYRSKAMHLESAVAGLEELAYTDAITGIPNSIALEKELQRTSDDPLRCLILLDLRNFGVINKRYNHWSGDEYLRQFSNMIVKTGRRNEFVFKRRPHGAFAPGGELGAMGGNHPKAFRKNQGGDEFFILLEGALIDGLGYLNRLKRRSGEFESMSQAVLGDIHPFGFHAGLTNVARNEPYESVIKRASECLKLAQDRDYPRFVYWSPDLPQHAKGSLDARIVADTMEIFNKTP